MAGPTAYLCCKDASAAIDFYCAAFGAEVLERYVDHDGRIGHAELKIGGGSLMLADEYPEVGFAALTASSTRAFQLNLLVQDLDVAFERAVAAGAVVVQRPSDDPHAGRRCTLTDPSGFRWSLGVASR